MIMSFFINKNTFINLFVPANKYIVSKKRTLM